MSNSDSITPNWWIHGTPTASALEQIKRDPMNAPEVPGTETPPEVPTGTGLNDVTSQASGLATWSLSLLPKYRPGQLQAYRDTQRKLQDFL